MTFSIYALPALLAFLTKVGVLFYDCVVRVRNLQTRLFLALLIAFALQNVAEIHLFLTYSEKEVWGWDTTMRLWYSAAILVVALLLHLCLAIAIEPGQSRLAYQAVSFLLYVPSVLLQILLWTGELLIVGFEPMNYSVTKIAGPLFFWWELYVVTYFAGAAMLLMYGACAQATTHRKLQSKLFLAGMAPLVLLAVAILVLQRAGFRGFNAAATLPFASILFVIVAAYAIYHYRLLDVAFYLPWSKVRRHKTELYRRIQAVAADIARLDSPRDILDRIAHTLRCRVTLLGGPLPWVAAPDNHVASGNNRPSAAFPREALTKVDRIITLEEAADRDPELYDLMKRYGVGAIVPLGSHPALAGYRLLLDRQFNNEIYSSLDFKIVDQLFTAMAQRFFEDFLLVRSQLAEAQEELRDATRKLRHARNNVTEVERELAAAKKINRNLREEVARLRRDSFKVIKPGNAATPPWGEKTLYQYLAEREKAALLWALERCARDETAAARLLGVPLHTLKQLMARYGVSDGR